MRMRLAMGWLMLACGLSPRVLPAQDADREIARLRDRVPDAVAARIVAAVDAATVRGLPARAMADLALRGVAQGRTADAVVAALGEYLEVLGAARAALEAAGRAPAAAEMEAAATALSAGVSADAIADLAAAAPEGRPLAVPLAVLGGLSASGMPVSRAVATLSAQLELGAGDAAIAAVGVAGARAGGRFPPVEVPVGRGPGIAIPVGGLTLPIAVPTGVPGNIGLPGGRPRPPVVPPVTPPLRRN
jgi:hypothetical protein